MVQVKIPEQTYTTLCVASLLPNACFKSVQTGKVCFSAQQNEHVGRQTPATLVIKNFESAFARKAYTRKFEVFNPGGG